MKRKILSILLVMTMGMSLLAGCGDKDNGTNGGSNQGNDSAISEDTGNDSIVSEDTGNDSIVNEGIGNDDSTDKQEEIDTSIYSEKIELITGKGQKVQVYYDPTVVNCIAGEDEMGEYCYLGEIEDPSVADAESAQAYVDSIISNNGGYLEIGEQKEISLSDYTVHYFRLNDTESGAFVGKEYIIELGSDVIFYFRYMGSAEEGGQLDTELDAIKFVVGDGIAIESNQNDNEEPVTEENLSTYELSDVMGEKVGVLTYNGDVIEFEKEVFDNIADFNMRIKNKDGSYTTGVTVQTIVCADAETYYQEMKGDIESNEKVTSSQFSEIKETDMNGITVQYFNRIYTMNGNENKDFYCFVDFPVVDNKEYAVVLSMHYGREDEVLLSGVENLIVDIEIQGVKPGAETEGATVKNDEFYDPWYDEICLNTSGGKTVNIYFVGEGGLSWEAEPDVPSSVYIYDKNQDMCFFTVSDAATPEERANNILQ